MSTIEEVTKERDNLLAALSAFVAHVERSVRPNQHNPYTARELYASLFAQADAALAASPEHKSTGCGACGDACAKRGSCRLADESPEAAR